MKRTCTNKNQCCGEDRCYCDEIETVILENGEMEMLSQILREQLRTFEEFPGRFRRFGSNDAVREKLSEILDKMRA